MDILSILKQVAPTVATALGGPLAGIAVEAIAKMMNVSPEAAQKVLDSGKLTGEQLTAIRQAEIELQKQAEGLGLDFAKLEQADKSSARAMQIATKSWIPGVLAIGVTGGFFGILIMLMTGVAQKGDEIMIMLGSLGTAWATIIGFYFGSSYGSQAKDTLLHQSVPADKSH